MNYTLCLSCSHPAECSACSFHLDRLREQMIISGIGGRIANEGFLSTADIDDVFTTAEAVILRLIGADAPETAANHSPYFEEA